ELRGASRTAARNRYGKLMSAPFRLRRDAVERPVRGGRGDSGKLRGSDPANGQTGARTHEPAVAREPSLDLHRSAADVRVARLPAMSVGSAVEAGRAAAVRGASDGSAPDVGVVAGRAQTRGEHGEQGSF